MPTITVEGPATNNLANKRKLVKKLTEAAVDFYGFPADTIVVVIKENAPENVGVGGTLVADR